MASVYQDIKRSKWTDLSAPDLDAFEQLAREALSHLPEDILVMCTGLQIGVAEYAEDEILDELGIGDPLELMGVFEGVGMSEDASVASTGQMPNRIWLFRRAILDYWAANDETLGDIVSHVLIHEIGHNFGLSDDDMERIEAAAG